MERITLQEFLELPNHEQFEILENEGKFLEDRSDGNRKKLLYAVDRFYVEVALQNQKNRVTESESYQTRRSG